MTRSARSARSSRRVGFGLVEALVGLALGALLLTGLLRLLTTHVRIARRQSQMLELQQSLRLARAELARAVGAGGRGGLRGGVVPEGLALTVVNSVAPGHRIGDQLVAAQTDVLVVRGVLTGALFDIERVESHDAASGDLVVAVTAGAALEDLLDLAAGEALLLSTVGGGCAVVELAGSILEEPEGVRLPFRTSGSERAEAYAELGEACEPRLEPPDAQRVGVLEEVRYYIRLDVGDAWSAGGQHLARIRLFPGTETSHPAAGLGSGDMVDHALDLQLALGVDRDGDALVTEGRRGDRASDEWLGNDPEDGGETLASGELSVLRVSLLLRSPRAVVGHLSPALEAIEDRVYDEPDTPGVEEWSSRRFLRGLTTRVVRWRSR